MQKKIVMDYSITSSIVSLYDDENICEKVDCEFIKSVQLIARPREVYYEEYSKKYRRSIFKYLYENEPLSFIIYNLIDIKKIFSVSLNTEETVIGLVMFIIIIGISVIEISSLAFLFVEKFKPRFQFLSRYSCFSIVLGSVIILYANFENLGEPTIFSCHMKAALLIFGNSFVFIPVLYTLISNFPVESKKIDWIVKNKKIFVLGLFLIKLLLIALTFVSPYSIETQNEDMGGHIFKRCVLSKGFNFISVNLVLLYKVIIMLVILFLSFLEWNIRNTRTDIKFITLSIYVDISFIISSMVLFYVKIKYYKLEYILKNILYIGIGVSNYLLLYGYRIILELMKSNKIENNNKDIKFYQNNNVFVTNKNSIDSSNVSNDSKKYENKIINLHFKKTSSPYGSGSLTSSESQ